MSLVPKSVSSGLARSILKTKKQSPHILFVGGVIGVIGTAVLASRATLRLSPTVDEIKNDFDAVTDIGSYDELGDKVQYTKAEYRRDVTYVYTKGAVKIAKLYGPTILLGGVSIAALTGSHVQLTKRNAALTATLAAVMEAYEAYRARVREEIGEEREAALYLDTRQQEVEIDGKKQTIETVNPSKYSPYARIFDVGNRYWHESSEINRNFLMGQQNYANQMLQTRGHVLLNDVYDALGFERTSAGAVLGWVKNSEVGDGYVDFSIWEGMNERVVGNWEPAIWLDFNVDGEIYKLIGD